ncbi:MAG: Na-translocating system protein MpsC family protein [Acidobacteriota bacterium]
MIPTRKQAYVKERLRKYAVNKTVELFAKGPETIDIRFNDDNVLLEMSGILNKFEMKIMETGDKEAASLLLDLRMRLYELVSQELHEVLGEIFNHKVVIQGPKIDLPNNTLAFNIYPELNN